MTSLITTLGVLIVVVGLMLGLVILPVLLPLALIGGVVGSSGQVLLPSSVVSQISVPSISGGSINDAQRYQLALAAGFRGEDAIIATAVSIAENGSGKLDALSATRDLGLWQINEVHWAQFGGAEALKDPYRNAQAAFSIWRSSGWCAWYTYETSCGPHHRATYRQHLTRAQQASAAQPVHGPLAGDNSSLASAIAPWMGVDYLFGGTTRLGVDCSAFVQAVLRQLGINVPRTAEQQWHATARVSTPAVGDLVFFKGTYGPANFISHVGFYMGDGVMISAAEPSVGRQSLTSGYWASHLAGYGRVH
jgi:cell wall-associated NlpC family hydrolase